LARIDPRAMRPAEVVRVLNSTPLGPVISERQLYRHRMRAGLRIGDHKHIDLLRYAAWLVEQLESRPPRGTRLQPRYIAVGDLAPLAEKRERGPRHAASVFAEGYERIREEARQRRRRLAAAGMEIGPIPAVANPKRRARAEKDFRYFCKTYFPAAFYLPWCDDHLKVIAKIERAVRQGGLFAMAMPRGSGKSALTRTAALWAVLAGLRRYVVIIAATASRAQDELRRIQTACETNEGLIGDWPEVLYPVRCLQRIAQRQKGQTHNGQHTRMEWLAGKLVLPTIMIDPEFDEFDLYEGPARSGGAILTGVGLTGGEIRGQNHYLPNGEIIRPDFVMIDDPQTTESAWSVSQCERREALLAGDVLGMAGPGRKIAGIMCCTVIRAGDMADNILDRKKHPEWQGERTKMVYSFPTNTKLWDEYARIRAESLRHDGDGREATEFYRKNRAAMDAGAVVAWPARYNPDEISAIQHAMNLKLRDEAAFFAEYQNEPLTPTEGDEEFLTADRIAAKTNGLRRGQVPAGALHLTMFVDVHDRLLYWAVCAWAEDFTGYVVDYGAYPDQKRAYFTLRDATRTLARVFQGAGREGAIEAGLLALLDEQLDREFHREDGSIMHIGRCLIDSGYVPDIVYEAIRRSGRAGVIMPSRGQGITAANKPISEYSRGKGDLIGYYWWIPSAKGKRILRTVYIDTNYWKTFIHTHLALAMGDKGCLSLFGSKPGEHRMLADHLTAEYRVRTEGRGRKVDEWKLPPARPDNHWFDCLVGCAVAASMLGLSVTGPATRERKVRQKRRRKVAYL